MSMLQHTFDELQDLHELRWIPLFERPWDWSDDRYDAFEEADFNHRYPRLGRTLRLDSQFTPNWVPGELALWDAVHAGCWTEVSVHNEKFVPTLQLT